MDEKKLQDLEKLAMAAMNATGTWEVNGLGERLRDAMVEIRQQNRLIERIRWGCCCGAVEAAEAVEGL